MTNPSTVLKKAQGLRKDGQDLSGIQDIALEIQEILNEPEIKGSLRFDFERACSSIEYALSAIDVPLVKTKYYPDKNREESVKRYALSLANRAKNEITSTIDSFAESDDRDIGSFLTGLRASLDYLKDAIRNAEKDVKEEERRKPS
ncbi:MAG: hypothetical protein LBM39_02095 [Candidatus Methanoplasma sp.]|jgi:hypothetical protein|nr:hypothetical protein [Candidatus Methanoplasma sp.]